MDWEHGEKDRTRQNEQRAAFNTNARTSRSFANMWYIFDLWLLSSLSLSLLVSRRSRTNGRIKKERERASERAATRKAMKFHKTLDMNNKYQIAKLSLWSDSSHKRCSPFQWRCCNNSRRIWIWVRAQQFYTYIRPQTQTHTNTNTHNQTPTFLFFWHTSHSMTKAVQFRNRLK